MRNIVLLASIILCSCRAYVPQPPSIRQDKLPQGCEAVYLSVKENWQRFRKSPCHKYYSEIETFGSVHKACLLQLDKTQVEGLFGKPDKFEEGNYIYVFSPNCPEEKSRTITYFKVIFDGDKVVNVDGWIREFGTGD